MRIMKTISEKRIQRAYDIAPIAEIIKLHQQGHGLDRLGRAHHVKLDVLQEILRREGVDLTYKSPSGTNTNLAAVLTEDKLRELWVVEGFTQEGIAKMFGVTVDTISKYIRRYKLTRQSSRSPVSVVSGGYIEEFRK